MVNPLQKLQLAEQQLQKLEALEESSNASSEINVKSSNNIEVRSFSNGENELEKLEEVTGTNEFESFVLVPDVIPKRWCPEVVPKVNTISEIEQIVEEIIDETQEADVKEIVYEIFSDPNEPSSGSYPGLLVVNGGTP